MQEGDLGTGLPTPTGDGPHSHAVVDVVRRIAPRDERRAAAGRAPRRTCACSPTPSYPIPRGSRALHRDRVAHLPVRLRDGVGVVGPLVLPGRTACLGCVELHRRGRDPGWPAVTAQLVGRHGRGDPATAAATAALAIAQVLLAVDIAGGGGTAMPPVLGATLELDLGTGELLHRPWPPASGLHVWRARGHSDVRAARRTGDNHEVMSAARPLK